LGGEFYNYEKKEIRNLTKKLTTNIGMGIKIGIGTDIVPIDKKIKIQLALLR
jgi:hypothetical protein